MRSLKVLAAHNDAIRARVKDDLALRLARDTSPAGLVDAAAYACSAMDDAGKKALANALALEPACSAGCSWCCHVHADATVPEILAVASHLREAWSPEALGALKEKLTLQAARVESLSDEARWGARIPCALLGDDGRCTIYEARPLRCRAFHSCSATPCREAFEGREDAEPVLNARLERAHDAVEEGYDQALATAGIAPEGHRLEIGLLIALGAPEAGDRWIAGEPVFARARRP